VLKKKLKPPFMPGEFLLTTTRQVPSTVAPPADAGGSGSSSHDEEQVAAPFNIDHFEGFSFVSPSEKQTASNVASLNNILFVGKPRLKTKKRRSQKTLPLEIRKELETTAPKDSKPGEVFTLQKLELLREQAARDNRNRTFITVGESQTSSQNAASASANIGLTRSSMDNIMVDESDIRARSKKSKKSRFRRTVSVGTLQRNSDVRAAKVASDGLSPRV
jgi:hypothetical protein